MASFLPCFSLSFSFLFFLPLYIFGYRVFFFLVVVVVVLVFVCCLFVLETGSLIQ